ncbi:PASTA domain-containing protein [Methylococcaceae bacterium WWC4]|nr:PASTA domain-containing protein [Methylococcaceae bacterium WWC4]
MLDGGNSTDVDGDPISYNWELLAKPNNSATGLQNPKTQTPSLTPDLPGSYTVQLKVNDGLLDSLPDQLLINTENSKPVANAGANQSALVGDAVTLDGSLSTDVDNDPLSYVWSILSKPVNSTPQLTQHDQIQAILTPDLPGDYVAQLIVNDSKLNSDPATSLVTVSAKPVVNHAPKIGSSPLTTATVGILYSYNVNATDSDNDTLSYSLSAYPTGMTIISQTGQISWTPAANQTGSQAVSVNVNDGQGGSDSQSFSITVNAADQVDVPAVIDQSRASAEASIQQAKLNIGTLTFQHNAKADGSVISQSPAAGSSVKIGSVVNLTVSIGPDNGLPPNPATVAPTLDQTVATTTYAASQFLYTGNNPIQTLSNGQALAAGTIEAKRAAVIRGTVLDNQNNPLSGVTVSIKDHPELGQTQTRADGNYDLAVNGGGSLTVNLAKTGLLPVQRQVTAPWQDYVIADDAVMIALDSRVTTVNLSATTPIQVAQGNPVSDSDGQRQATLMIPQGTKAQVYNPDGSLRDTSSLTLHLTEYTVGANGPHAMPGPLPPTSAYTYAVELTAEEASVTKAGKEVVFDRPVPFYVDNFLNFPTGTTVPVGYYDRESSKWIPSNNGIVIKILSATGGLANIDSNGDNSADTASQLAALGITDTERQTLATLYPANKSLWRAQFDHMSIWDLNWLFGPPADATPPGGYGGSTSGSGGNSGGGSGGSSGGGSGGNSGGGSGGSSSSLPSPSNKDDKNPTDPNCHKNSIVVCEHQTLGEQLPLSGTPFNLFYFSDRTPGRTSGRVVDIPLSGASVPASLKRIDLEISLGGRQFTQSFPANPNQTYQFTWDGLDAYGRPFYGTHQANVNVGFVYDGSYKKTDRFGYNGNGVPITGNKSRTEITLWKYNKVAVENSFQTALGSPGLGAWSVDINHSYDPVGQVLYMGDGTKRSAKAVQNAVIDTIAGGGSPADGLGDGKPATEAALTDPRGLAIAADGTIYVADRRGQRVRRISPNGIISTFAGNGSAGFSGDGGPATAATLHFPEDIALGLDGSLYIADSYNGRVRRVGLDGVITTVAGGGNSSGGVGGAATSVGFYSIESIAIGSDGSLFVKDWPNNVMRVGADGLIQNVAPGGMTSGGIATGPDGSLYVTRNINRFTHAHEVKQLRPDGSLITVVKGTDCQPILGNPYPECLGDGGEAINAGLTDVHGMAVGSDNTIFISDAGHGLIRAITPEGVIKTIAGGGAISNSVIGDGGFATKGFVNYAQNIAIGPDDSLYISDQYVRVRRVKKALPAVSLSETAIASEDGNELYVFDGTRHLRTLNTLTGAVKYQFNYDTNGNLSKITDASNNVTTIERNGQGQPTAIVAPFGQRTRLVLDSNGYLASVTNPAGETYSMTYTSNGLLTAFKDPRGNASAISYDALGRLFKDQNAGGGSQTLTRTELDLGYQIDRSSDLGRTTRYLVEQLNTGDEHRLVTGPDGTATDTLKKTDGSVITTEADGTITTAQQGPDPRFGVLAAFPTSTEIRSGGLTQTTNWKRTVDLAVPTDNLSLKKLTDTVTINGRTATTVYDAATKTATAKSAAGRVSTTTIDNLARPVQRQLAGLFAINSSYDDTGHLARISQGSNPDQRVVDFTYNPAGYLATVTDPLNRQVAFEYDQAGRVTKQTLPNGRDVLYSYDANGNLASLTPPGQPAHLFSYTKLNQVGDYDPPTVNTTGNNTVYQYDLDKALTKITRPDGLELNFTYDSAGRLAKQTVPEGDTLYAYHASTGKLASITVPDGGKLAYGYNGRFLTETDWSGAIAGSVGYGYDNDFRLSSINVNSADSIAYNYDADSLLVKAGDLTLNRSSQNGLLTGTTLGAVTDSLNYNGFGEAANYEAKINGSSVFKVDYTRDALGRITHKVETLGATVATYDYAYDTAGRLAQVKKNNVLQSSYSYDDNGNRLTRTQGAITTSGSYDAQDRLLSYGNANYAYTDNGELKTKTVGGQVTGYSYDVLSNLRKVTLPSGSVIDYLVDGQNRRIGKKLSGNLVQGFLWQDQLKPIAELDASGNIVSRFVYANRQNVPDYMIKGGVTYRIVTDHLGSPRLVVKTADGTVMQRMEYDEFGKVTSDSNPGFQPFGFAGGLYDRDTGLVRFGARDFDAVTGRWVSKDPIMFRGDDVDLYSYVFGNPTNIIDPNGKCPSLTDIWNAIRGARKINDAVNKGEDAAKEINSVNEMQQIDNNNPKNDILDSPENMEWFRKQYAEHYNAGGSAYQTAVKNYPITPP